MRIGVYSDLVYRSDGERIWTHQAFIRFVTSLPPRVDELVVFGRLHPERARSHYALPDEVRFVPLPHYARVTSVLGQLRVLRRTWTIFARELGRLDAVWIFGPHPIAVALALAARRRGAALVLGVRQDYPAYIAGRLPSRRWAWAVVAAHALDATFRVLARSAPTIAVGDDLARKYARSGGAVLSTGFSLVRADDVVSVDEAVARSSALPARLLSVGRLDPEKNPLLLVDVLARLRARDERWRLTIAGDGPLASAIGKRAVGLGVADAVELVGYVAQGDALRNLYRAHDVFLHVSLTEGFPQVLFEAQAAGTPVVATAVGGVAAAVERHRSAVLVPPSDPESAAAAVTRVAADAALRRDLVLRGLENAREQTMEAQLDRIVRFLREELARPRR
jgi:glycosyltransferase involved in cell wall biosynthesis